MQLKSLNRGVLAAMVMSVLAAAAPMAQATGEVFDATTYTPTIALTIPGILAIGGAVFLVILALKSTKWGRRAL